MKFKKEMAELRRRKVVSKKLAVDKFKASKEYKEGLEGATSLYFGKGFNQSKKAKIARLSLPVHLYQQDQDQSIDR